MKARLRYGDVSDLNLGELPSYRCSGRLRSPYRTASVLWYR